jgi:chromosomal replication initiator protein
MHASLWDNIKKIIKKDMLPLHFELWISPISSQKLNDKILVLNCPHEFSLSYINDNYRSLIEKTLKTISGADHAIELKVLEIETKDNEIPKKYEKKRKPFPKNKHFFSNFILGPENRFGFNAAKEVLSKPGKWNPLFLYGKSGVGKTHLLGAIHSSAKEKGLNSKYLRGFEFLNQYTQTARENSYLQFYQKFNNLDLLLIDDIQIFNGKTKTLETFYNINTLHDSGTQIILCSNRKPNEIVGLNEALLSRISWGLLIEIEPPEFESRTKIIHEKLKNINIEFQNNTLIPYIASKPIFNVRLIEGILYRLSAIWEFQELKITKQIIDIEVEKILQTSNKNPQIGEVQQTVCSYFNISKKELSSKTRAIKIARPRQVAMYLAKKHTNESLPSISTIFGKKSHSTVSNACDKIEKLQKSDEKLKADIKNIEEILKV